MSREKYVAKMCACFLGNEKQGLRVSIGQIVLDEDAPPEAFAQRAFDISRNSLKRLFLPVEYQIIVVEEKGKEKTEHRFGLDYWVKLKEPRGQGKIVAWP